MAKRIVHLVCAVGAKINSDPDTKDLLRLYFLPDYNVTAAETLIPAAELSQHISTAGTEASGKRHRGVGRGGGGDVGCWCGCTKWACCVMRRSLSA